ncbi:phosphopyruvate hydratase [Candidatus Roizmanbacteria bacterium]|nr:phosphopyruvate hydratase [Candidatus Roizmanbacteria bacterium]
MKISRLSALEILDSRGRPTVRAFIELEDGSRHSASVPSGASTGSHEAVERRDNNPSHYLSQGVQNAVHSIETELNDLLKNKEVSDIQSIDEEMIQADGTENKSRLGANALLAVSLAAVRAASYAEKKPVWQFIHDSLMPDSTPRFPRCMTNVVNGGKHASWNFDIQEFMVVPMSETPSMFVEVASTIFHTLGAHLKKLGCSTLVGDEGGFSPALSSNEEVFQVLIASAKEAGYENGVDYQLAIDAAASEFYEQGAYLFKKEQKTLSGEELIEFYLALQKKYALFSFEDPFQEDDWEHFQKFTEKVNDLDCLVVGDDLFVTNAKRIQVGIDKKAANTVLIKVNQIGTLSETIEAIRLARSANWDVIISHRSGETEDSFIADLAYGVGADFIKTGSMSRSERLAKYNRLLEIEKGY